MALTARSIDVNAPLRAVYDQWTRFEEFPLLMEGVEEVVRLESEKFLLCKIKDWEAEITNQVSDQEISWESVDGSSNSGTITFGKLDPQWTRVTASIGYEPEGILEKTGEVLGINSGRVKRDLEQFRDYIQGKAKGSNGWRRRVANENTVESDVLPMGGPAFRKGIEKRDDLESEFVAFRPSRRSHRIETLRKLGEAISRVGTKENYSTLETTYAEIICLHEKLY
jgi:hypothetical protein